MLPTTFTSPSGTCHSMLATAGQTWPEATLGSSHSYATLVGSNKPQPFHCEPMLLLNGKACLLDGWQGIPAWRASIAHAVLWLHAPSLVKLTCQRCAIPVQVASICKRLL